MYQKVEKNMKRAQIELLEMKKKGSLKQKALDGINTRLGM